MTIPKLSEEKLAVLVKRRKRKSLSVSTSKMSRALSLAVRGVRYLCKRVALGGIVFTCIYSFTQPRLIRVIWFQNHQTRSI